MTHICTQQDAIKKLSDKIDLLKHDEPSNKTMILVGAVQDDLAQHRIAQQAHSQLLDQKLDSIIEKIESMYPTVEEVKNLSRLLGGTNRVVIGMAKIIVAIGIIIGSITAIKDFLKK